MKKKDSSKSDHKKGLDQNKDDKPKKVKKAKKKKM
jgi:hypothetical protein